MAQKTSWFERNPKKTLVGVVVVCGLLFDFGLGWGVLPRRPGRPHPYYHHGLKKNYRGQAVWGNEEYAFFTNSLGFRDSQNSFVPLTNPDAYRIVLIGDSFTEGIGLVYQETFGGILTNHLKRFQIDVLNAGVRSYSPKLYYLKIKYLIEHVGLHFDELYVFLDISDVQDEVAYKDFRPSLSYVKKPKEIVKVAHQFLKEHSVLYNRLGLPCIERIRGVGNLGNSSQAELSTGAFTSLLPFVSNSVSTHIASDEQERKSILDWKASFYNNYYQDRPRWTYDPKIYEAWGKKGLTLAENFMKKLVLLCERHHIKLSIAVYPWPQQIERRELESIHVTFWETFTRQHHLGFLNYFPKFMHSKNSEEVYKTCFIPGDVHWNAVGHAMIAEELLNTITR